MNTAKSLARYGSMRFFYAASLLIHVLVLLIPLRVPLHTTSEQPDSKLFAVELVPAQAAIFPDTVSDAVERPAADLADRPFVRKNRQVPQAPPASEPHEATVSLDSLHDADVRYRSYLAHLRSKIGSVWQYPAEAREQGLAGVVTVRFTLARNGSLESLAMSSNSPHPLLDNEALRTVRAAAPFKPFPSAFTIQKLHVLASFEYEFSSQ